MKKGIVGIFSFFFFAVSAFSLEIPKLQGYVNDYASVISPEYEAKLTDSLSALEAQTTAQIFVLTIPSLEGEEISSFAFSVAENWGIGQKGEDNGALMLISMDERKIRIEVGYGLEGVLTDTKCGLIIRNILAPAFREGDYSRGIFQAVSTMIEVAGGDDTAVADLAKKENRGASGSEILKVLFVIIFWLLFLGGRGRFHIIPIFFGGHYGGYRGGGFGGGFGGGGGFSGGGGGRFGGGGASGGW